MIDHNATTTGVGVAAIISSTVPAIVALNIRAVISVSVIDIDRSAVVIRTAMDA